jgi:hypothetical protein
MWRHEQFGITMKHKDSCPGSSGNLQLAGLMLPEFILGSLDFRMCLHLTNDSYWNARDISFTMITKAQPYKPRYHPRWTYALSCSAGRASSATARVRASYHWFPISIVLCCYLSIITFVSSSRAPNHSLTFQNMECV